MPLLFDVAIGHAFFGSESNLIVEFSFASAVLWLIYSREMETQHQNILKYIKDILNILLQRMFSDFRNTEDWHDIDFIRFNVKYPNVYTHARIRIVV